MRAISMLLSWLLYWGGCFLCTGTDRKNLLGLRSYPDEVQQRVRQTLPPHSVPPKKSLSGILLSNFAFFTVLFSALGLVFKKQLKLTRWKSAFAYFLALGEGLGLFDLLVIDLLWWRKSKRLRFSFLPQAELYQDPTKHIASFLRGIPLFAVIAFFAALIVVIL